MSGSGSVNVSFRVNGGEVQSYMDKLQQKAAELTRTMLKSATQESDVAKEQLKSYQLQISLLERKLRGETELARISAQINRDARVTALRSEIGQRYTDLDTKLASGEITGRQHRVQSGALDAEEQSRTLDIDDQRRIELTTAREQQRDNALLLRTMRDNVDAVQTTSRNELTQMRRGDESLVDAVRNEDQDPTAALANRLASQQHIEEQAAQQKDKKGFTDTTFGSVLKALTMDHLGGMLANIPNVKNELDYVKPISAMTGMAVGGAAGSVIDAATGAKLFGTGIGQTQLGTLMASLGEKVGEFTGSAVERMFKSRTELSGINFRNQALTGVNFGIDAFSSTNGLAGTGKSSITKDLSEYGADFKQVAEMQNKIALAQGTAKNLGGGAENMIALQHGLGIQPEAFLEITQLLRSSQAGNRDVTKLIGGVLSAGKSNIFSQDRSFLGEFMTKNFTGLQQTLLQTQNNVGSATTFDILRKFDKLGGPFSARDMRSGGLINTVQGALSNPGSDNLKAMSFMALRSQNPKMGFESLLEEQQKGLASPTYLKAMLAMVDKLGGDRDMRIMNTAQMLGLGGNLAAARKIYEGKGGLTKVATGELSAGAYSEGAIRGMGKDNTSVYDKHTAQIENAFTEDAVKGVKLVGTLMKDLFAEMMIGVGQYVRDTINESIASGKASPKANKTITGAAKGAFNSKGQAQVDRTRPTGAM
jgi:flagellar hook-basal body complex protein FliE